MAGRISASGPPSRILFATDLSARCDRAFDRSLQLAVEWQAEVILLTVLEDRLAPDEVYSWWTEGTDNREHFVRRQIARELAGLSVPVSVQISEGDVADTIGEVAMTSESDLIVAGTARSEPLGRFWLGSTVERLARSLAQPVLVVRQRVHNPYHRILVATDFSDSSRHALQTALQLFPDRGVILYHAFGIRANRDDDAIRLAIEQGECAAFLAESELSPEDHSRLQIVIERGKVGIALPRFVKLQEMYEDLVVLGTRGRNQLLNMLIGSSALELLEWLPCDTLLVRQPRSND